MKTKPLTIRNSDNKIINSTLIYHHHHHHHSTQTHQIFTHANMHACNHFIEVTVMYVPEWSMRNPVHYLVCLSQQVDSFIAPCVYYPSICAPYFPVYCKYSLKLNVSVFREGEEHLFSVHIHNKRLDQWWGASAGCSVWTETRCVWCCSLVSSILSQLPQVCRPGVLGIHSLRLQPRWALLCFMSAVFPSQEIREEKSRA